jgi:hypothetical protein
MADEVQRSIMKTRFRESSKQDFAVISKLAEVYADDCKYQLLVVELRRKLEILSAESSPWYYFKFVYKYKSFSSEDSGTLKCQSEYHRPPAPPRPELSPCSYLFVNKNSNDILSLPEKNISS